MAKTPLLQADPRQLGIEKAAWLLEDATHGEKPDIKYPEDLMSARKDYYTYLRVDRWCRRAVWGLVIVTIVEVPSWCLNTHEWTIMAPEDRCRAPGGSPIYLSGLTYWPPGVTVCIEVVLILILLRKYLLERQFELTYFEPGGVSYRDIRKAYFGIAMGVLALCDVAVFWIFRPHFRVAFLARFGFLCLLPAVRSLALCVVAVLNEFVSVAMFLIGTMVFFAWIAVTIFDDIKILNSEGDRVNEGLDGFGTACYSMFVAGTSDDFVDVFLPTYVAYRQAGLLWLAFLVAVQLLFLNLVLDTLVAAYTKYTDHKNEEQFSTQVKGILRSFRQLCEAVCPGEDEISKQAFLEFCAAVSRSPRMPMLTQDTADIMFQALDKDGSGYMSQDEFVDICGVFQYQFWTTKRDSLLETCCPSVWNTATFKWFRGAVWSGGFDDFMNCILGLNFILVVTESVYDLHDWKEPKWMTRLDLIFSLSYAGEVFAKLSVYSLEEYWSETSNQFDFWTTWLLLSTCLLQGVLSRYANLLRLLRLLRVLKQLKTLKSVQFMIATIQQLVICSKDILTLLGVVVFFFTTLGVQLWGGLLYDTNPDLEGSEYLEKKWAVLNFNDVPSGFALWFVMLLCEYVACLADAVHRTTHTPMTWLVFPLFYVSAVSIVFELVKAFTIEVFIDLHEKKDEEPEPEFECLEDTKEEYFKTGQALHFKALGDISKRGKLLDAYHEILESGEHEGHGGHGTDGGGGHGHGVAVEQPRNGCGDYEHEH